MGKKIYVCLRDDDTNGLTSVEELKNAYGNIWGEIPITLATVPFAHGSERKIMDYDSMENKFMLLREWEKNASADELTEYHKVHPIGENRLLVDELKKQISKGKIEIALHGVFHRYNERGGEMHSDEMAFEAIRDGKEYLEKVFVTPINIFIPPSNTIDKKCVSYLKKLNLVLFCSGSIWFKNKIGRFLSYLEYPESLIEKIHGLITGKHQAMRKRCGIFLFSSITYDIFKSREFILNQLKTEISKTGIVALGTHYRLFQDQQYKEEFHKLINDIKNLGEVEFITATQYYNKCKELYYE